MSIARGSQRLAGLLLLGAVAAARGSEGRDVSLTVYNTDLGAVRDERDLPLETGLDTLRFTDVPARIDPTSVHLEAVDGKPLQVLEQNYAYDLVSASAVLDRYLDRAVRIRDEDGEIYEGILQSHAGDQILMAPDTGGVVILRKDRIAEIRCPELPQGLTTRPTLIWLLSTDRGGPRRARVSYLTQGLSWTARYVAVVNEGETEVLLGAWVNVTNECGADFPGARLQLVAGDVHRVTERPVAPRMKGAETMAMMDGGFEEEAFFEYHLYTLERRTTLSDRETKQISLFPPARTEVEKEYEFASWKGNKIRVVLSLVNSRERGLGLALPAGIVRVYKADGEGRLQFVGEDRIDHTPKDEEVRLFLGEAFDLVAERTVKDQRRLSDRVREQDIEISLRNRKDSEGVEIIVEEYLGGDWTILRSSVPYEPIDAQKVEFRVRVAAGEEGILSYTVRYQY